MSYVLPAIEETGRVNVSESHVTAMAILTAVMLLDDALTVNTTLKVSVVRVVPDRGP